MVLRGKACPVSKDALLVFCSLLECFFLPSKMMQRQAGRFGMQGRYLFCIRGRMGKLLKTNKRGFKICNFVV